MCDISLKGGNIAINRYDNVRLEIDKLKDSIGSIQEVSCFKERIANSRFSHYAPIFRIREPLAGADDTVDSIWYLRAERYKSGTFLSRCNSLMAARRGSAFRRDWCEPGMSSAQTSTKRVPSLCSWTCCSLQ